MGLSRGGPAGRAGYDDRLRTRVLPVVLLAASAIAGGVASAAADAGARRRGRGRVVRVPRPPLVLSTDVRTCSLFDEATATCDRAVAPGDTGLLIDDEGNHGAATVTGVTVESDSCGNPVSWKATVALQRTGDRPTSGLFVLDYPLDDRARRLVPDGGPQGGEQVMYVVDRDGDGDGDLRVTQYSCDHKGVLERTARPRFICTDYWLAFRDRWQRARSDRAAVCDR